MPITDMLYVPVRVELVVDIVNAELHVGLQDIGVNEQVAPDGNPEQLNDTDCVVPETKVAVVVVVAELPCTTVPEVGDVDIEKSNAALTVRVYVAVLVSAPAVPVTAML